MKNIILILIVFNFLNLEAKENRAAKVKETIQSLLSSKVLPCFDELVKDYENSGKSASMLYGRINFSFDVDDIGRTKNIEIVDSTIMTPEVFEMCIYTALEAQEFPKTPKGQKATYTYPIVFSKKK